jgi:hypothetical protein
MRAVGMKLEYPFGFYSGGRLNCQADHATMEMTALRLYCYTKRTPFVYCLFNLPTSIVLKC